MFSKYYVEGIALGRGWLWNNGSFGGGIVKVKGVIFLVYGEVVGLL